MSDKPDKQKIAEVVAALDPEVRKRLDALADLAVRVHGTDDIEVDGLQSEHEISEGADGIWVRAWVHISNEILEENGIDNPEAG